SPSTCAPRHAFSAVSVFCLFFFFIRDSPPRQLHSFPTRRSSDLPRCGELLRLRWPDIDLTAPGSFTIQGTKTERSHRTIHLGQANVVALGHWRHAQQRESEKSGVMWTHSGMVFTELWGKRISRHSLQEHFIQQ